jgi:hypothetical protein
VRRGFAMFDQINIGGGEKNLHEITLSLALREAPPWGSQMGEGNRRDFAVFDKVNVSGTDEDFH